VIIDKKETGMNKTHHNGKYGSKQAKQHWMTAMVNTLRKTLRKGIPAVMLSAVFAVSTFTISTQAAVINQLKSDVDAVKHDTATIKYKSSDIQSRMKALGLTTNAQIMEIIDIRELVDPLLLVRGMKDKLVGDGFDPAELLDNVDTQALIAKLDEMKENRAEMARMLNDPGLDDFRKAFLNVLQGFNRIATGGGPLEITPFQTWVTKGPASLITALKVGSETSFGPLRESVVLAVESLEEVRTLGLLKGSSGEKICIAVAALGLNHVYGVLWTYQNRLLEIKKANHKFYQGAKKYLAKHPNLPDIGIHGYLTIPLSKTGLLNTYIDAHQILVGDVEHAMKKNGLWMDKLKWIQHSPQEPCGKLP